MIGLNLISAVYTIWGTCMYGVSALHCVCQHVQSTYIKVRYLHHKGKAFNVYVE